MIEIVYQDGKKIRHENVEMFDFECVFVQVYVKPEGAQVAHCFLYPVEGIVSVEYIELNHE